MYYLAVVIDAFYMLVMVTLLLEIMVSPPPSHMGMIIFIIHRTW